MLKVAALPIEFLLSLIERALSRLEILLALREGDHLLVMAALDGPEVLELRLDGGEDLRDPLGGVLLARRSRRLRLG